MELVIEKVPAQDGKGETRFCYVVGLRCRRHPEEGVGFLLTEEGWQIHSALQGPFAGAELPQKDRVPLEALDEAQRRTLHNVVAGYVELEDLVRLFPRPGLRLRIYDKPGTVDRYTAVVEGEAVWLPGAGKHWFGYGFGTNVSPQGFFQRTEIAPDVTPGRPVRLADLPEEARQKLLEELKKDFAPYYPDLSEED